MVSYESFISILNSRISNDGDENYNLLVNVINNPARYCGLFRLSNAKSKLIQNLTQSKEIKFGDFMEDIITRYFELSGFENLEKNLGVDANGDVLNVDQLFSKDGYIYFIEQKVRDDHDSTKKRGQFENFVKKLNRIKILFPNKTIKGSMWFIDPSLIKNKNYYLNEMDKLNDRDIRLFYGMEVFEYLGIVQVWNEIVSHLSRRRDENSKEVLNVPDFDTSDEIYNAIVNLSTKDWNKLNSNSEIYILLRKELFPTGYNLRRARNVRR